MPDGRRGRPRRREAGRRRCRHSRGWHARRAGRQQHVEPVLRCRGAAGDPQVVIQCQHDGPGAGSARGGWRHERPGLALPQRGRQRGRGTGEEGCVGGAERFACAGAPQVEEAPAAELISKDHRGHVTDGVPAHDLAPDQAAGQVAVDGVRQPADGRGRVPEGGPAVDRRGVLRLDQSRQLGHAGHVGEGRGADRGDRVGEQPDVSVEVDHLAEDREYLAAQVHRVRWRSAGRRRAEGLNALACSGQGPGAGHSVSVCAGEVTPRESGIPGGQRGGLA
jgi:hypothetical protein